MKTIIIEIRLSEWAYNLETGTERTCEPQGISENIAKNSAQIDDHEDKNERLSEMEDRKQRPIEHLI